MPRDRRLVWPQEVGQDYRRAHVLVARVKEYLVDTNLILGLIGADPGFGPASKDCLTRCSAAGILVIKPVIYADVGAVIETVEELDELLPAGLFRRDPLPWEASYLAGRAFYR